MSEQVSNIGVVLDDVEQGPETESGRPKTGFIAVLGNNILRAETKRELKSELEKRGINDVTIIRGKVLPTAKITRLSF